MEATVFAVGEHYANGTWEYEVLEITGPYMVVRSDDGQTRKLEVATAAKLWAKVQTKRTRRASRERAAGRI
jgi:hypothetical protein